MHAGLNERHSTLGSLRLTVLRCHHRIVLGLLPKLQMTHRALGKNGQRLCSTCYTKCNFQQVQFELLQVKN